MGFQEINDTNCDVVISLGGVNKKTGKANPKEIIGYYLGSRKVADKKKKTGFSYIYALQTEKGNIGVWGKTDLDRKMKAVELGFLVKLSNTGKTRPTANGDMQLFSVAVDKDNQIEVTAAPVEDTTSDTDTDSYTAPEGSFTSNADDEEYAETALDEDEPAADVIVPQRAPAPRQVAQAPDAARQAKVKALLNRSKATA